MPLTVPLVRRAQLRGASSAGTAPKRPASKSWMAWRISSAVPAVSFTSSSVLGVKVRAGPPGVSVRPDEDYRYAAVGE
jgi:hypothetical protein